MVAIYGLLNQLVLIYTIIGSLIYVGLSRGRGIACYNSLPAILNHIKVKDTEWVAQKYLENALIVKNKKVSFCSPISVLNL